jgi:TatA/E family protein of Tat protein translocase
MDFFGMGAPEILVILVVALVVVGPRKLPELGRQVGRAIYQFRKATQDLSNEFTREFMDVRDVVQDTRNSLPMSFKPLDQITSALNETRSTINQSLNAPITYIPPSVEQTPHPAEPPPVPEQYLPIPDPVGPPTSEAGQEPVVLEPAPRRRRRKRPLGGGMAESLDADFPTANRALGFGDEAGTLPPPPHTNGAVHHANGNGANPESPTETHGVETGAPASER